MRISNFVLLPILLLAISARAWSSTVQWTAGNGHWYQAIAVTDPTGISWTDANAAATSSGGYLVTITSAAENDFVFSLVNSPDFWHDDEANNSEGPWLGAYYDDPNYTDPVTTPIDTTHWNWVSGEAWTYSNWATNEPSDYEDEFYANFFAYQGGGTTFASTWNNIPDVYDPYYGSNSNVEVHGYIIEWDSEPVVVPIPPAIWLLGSGLVGLIAIGRKSTIGG